MLKLKLKDRERKPETEKQFMKFYTNSLAYVAQKEPKIISMVCFCEFFFGTSSSLRIFLPTLHDYLKCFGILTSFLLSAAIACLFFLFVFSVLCLVTLWLYLALPSHAIMFSCTHTEQFHTYIFWLHTLLGWFSWLRSHASRCCCVFCQSFSRCFSSHTNQ